MFVALATCADLPEPDPDRELHLDALAAAGVDARWLAWDDPSAPFDDALRVVIRSTWNYHLHHDRFLAWAERVADRLLNPLPVVRWNSHKGYLGDLARNGIAVVPTEYLARTG